MAPLPNESVTVDRTFNHCGVDFSGPIQINSSIRRVISIKCYVAIFVCFVTRAVDLELVTNLFTEGFLAALSCFMSRQGVCSHIYSDNAIHFVETYSHLALFFFILFTFCVRALSVHIPSLLLKTTL